MAQRLSGPLPAEFQFDTCDICTSGMPVVMWTLPLHLCESMRLVSHVLCTFLVKYAWLVGSSAGGDLEFVLSAV